jgi:hypothetical protein
MNEFVNKAGASPDLVEPLDDWIDQARDPLLRLLGDGVVRDHRGVVIIADEMSVFVLDENKARELLTELADALDDGKGPEAEIVRRELVNLIETEGDGMLPVMVIALGPKGIHCARLRLQVGLGALA